jgi:ParB family chromosome partitioning protein
MTDPDMATKGKIVLGKGLDALIPKPSITEPRGEGESTRAEVAGGTQPAHIAEIEIDKVQPNPYQPRMDFDQQALDELKQSIAERGLVQPITVRRGRDGTYQLISGERRVRAAREAGLARIPAYIIEVKTDEEMLELALIENLQREHLNPVEVAISYQRLINECSFTQEEVAKKVSKDRTTVTNFLRLLKLPAQIQQSLRKGDVSMGHARALVNLPDDKTQLRVWRRIQQKGLSVRQVEEIVRRIGTPAMTQRKPAGPALTVLEGSTLVLENFATRLRYILGTKVKIHPKEEGKGEIVIEYYSDEDLGRILDLFNIIEKQSQ